jgi:predicted Rdx family selenoprotein
LIDGAGGIFDVVADGTLIFSKFAAGRFPEESEILTKLAPR